MNYHTDDCRCLWSIKLFQASLMITLLALGPLASANETDGEYRKWTSSAGTTMEAMIVKISEDGESVTLKGKNGKMVTVATAKLLASDRAYLEKAANKAGEANEVNSADSEFPAWATTLIKKAKKDSVLCLALEMAPNSKREIEVKADAKWLGVGFLCDRGEELAALDPSDVEDPGWGRSMINLKSLHHEGEGMGGYGTGSGSFRKFTSKEGQLRLELHNPSKFKVRLAIFTRPTNQKAAGLFGR